MDATDLRKWMEIKGKKVVDVSASTRIHSNTINKFLQGKRVNDSTKMAFERLIKDDPINPADQKATD